MTSTDFASARLALGQARNEFESRLDLVSDDQWNLATPCEEWTVRDLVAHLIGGAKMSGLLLGGAEKDEALRVLFALTIDGDAKTAFRESSDAQAAAFEAPGAADAMCHHPSRDMPGSDFIWLRIRDTVVHAWDLARAIGGDETLDADLVATIWSQVEPLAPLLGASGMFGTGGSGNLADGAPLQLRLLDALGRRP